MNENCNDCAWIQNLKEDVTSLKNDIKDIYERLGEVEMFKASGGEQIKMIFKILNEIKDSIGDISKVMLQMREEPGKQAQSIKIAIISSVCSGIIGVMLGLIFKFK
jgi:hypothetical protein